MADGGRFECCPGDGSMCVYVSGGDGPNRRVLRNWSFWVFPGVTCVLFALVIGLAAFFATAGCGIAANPKNSDSEHEANFTCSITLFFVMLLFAGLFGCTFLYWCCRNRRECGRRCDGCCDANGEPAAGGAALPLEAAAPVVPPTVVVVSAEAAGSNRSESTQLLPNANPSAVTIHVVTEAEH